MNGLGELMPARCWQLNSPSNSFQSIFSSAAHTSEKETQRRASAHATRFTEFCHRFSLTSVVDIFVHTNKECRCLKSRSGIPSSGMSLFLSSPCFSLCVVYEFTFTQCVSKHPPFDLQTAQGGFGSLCKRPRKMFSDKLFTIPQSFWAERCITLRDALHIHAAPP